MYRSGDMLGGEMKRRYGKESCDAQEDRSLLACPLQ